MTWSWWLCSLPRFSRGVKVFAAGREDECWDNWSSLSVFVNCHWIVILRAWNRLNFLRFSWMCTYRSLCSCKWYFNACRISDFNSALRVVKWRSWSLSPCWTGFAFFADSRSIAISFSWVTSSIGHFRVRVVHIWPWSCEACITHEWSLCIAYSDPCTPLKMPDRISIVRTWSYSSNSSTALNNRRCLGSNWYCLMGSSYRTSLRVLCWTRA